MPISLLLSDKYKLGDKQGAIADATEAIRLQPDDARSYGFRGIRKYELGDKQGARMDLQKAAEILQKQGETEAYNLIIKQLEEIK